MSLAPVTPNFSNFTPKSFWKKPEGGPGYVLIALLIAGGGFGLYPRCRS